MNDPLAEIGFHDAVMHPSNKGLLKKAYYTNLYYMVRKIVEQLTPRCVWHLSFGMPSRESGLCRQATIRGGGVA